MQIFINETNKILHIKLTILKNVNPKKNPTLIYYYFKYFKYFFRQSITYK